MEFKICTKCGVNKEFREYYTDKTKKSGYRNDCKICRNKISKLYRNLNKEKIKLKNKENLKKWRIKNIDYIKKQKKEWYLKNIERSKINDKKWAKNNSEKIKEFRKKARNKIIKTDPLFKLSCRIRSMINKNLKRVGCIKKSRTHEILGCSFEEFKLHLESKFEPWMNWENRGLYNGELNYGWDIDHVIPLASAKTEDEILKLNHYTNLQPLCSYTNRYIKKDNF